MLVLVVIGFAHILTTSSIASDDKVVAMATLFVSEI